MAVVGVDAGNARMMGVNKNLRPVASKGRLKTLVDVFERCMGGAHMFDGGGWKNAIYRRYIDACLFDGVNLI